MTRREVELNFGKLAYHQGRIVRIDAMLENDPPHVRVISIQGRTGPAAIEELTLADPEVQTWYDEFFQKPAPVDLSEAMKLKLMDVAMKFSYDKEDFLNNYLWLHNQAVSFKRGSLDQDPQTQNGEFEKPAFESAVGDQKQQVHHYDPA